MNRIILIAAAAACALSVSCSQGFSTVTHTQEKSAALTEGATDSIEIKISATYPQTGMSEAAMAEMSKTITSRMFGEKYAAYPAEKAISAYTDDMVTEYRAANLPLKEKFKDEPIASLSWADWSEGEIAGFYGNIVSYIITKYSFTGGAHGNTAETACNFDRKTGSMVSEKDIFTTGYESRLKDAVNANVPAEKKSELFTAEIEPNGNFTVSDKGITYIYNQYEIAPYSSGVISVTVPWEDIKEILQ